MAVYFDIDDLPEIGSRVEFTRDGERLQMFTLIGAEDHDSKRTGEATAILAWATDCADCGAAITFTTGPATNAMYRRCKPCGQRFTRTREGGWPTGSRVRHTLLEPLEGSEVQRVAVRAAAKGRRLKPAVNAKLKGAVKSALRDRAAKEMRREPRAMTPEERGRFFAWIDANPQLTREEKQRAVVDAQHGEFPWGAEEEIDPESLF